MFYDFIFLKKFCKNRSRPQVILQQQVWQPVVVGQWSQYLCVFFCIFVFVNVVISVFVYFCRPQVILQQEVWQTVVVRQWSQWPAYIVLPPLSREIIHWNNKASKENKNYKQQQQQWSQWWEIINCRKNSTK